MRGINQIGKEGVSSWLVLGGASVLLAIVIWKRLSGLWNGLPRSWTRVASLSNIYIYPVKSGQYLSLTEAQCTTLGVTTTKGPFTLRDRHFIVFRAGTGEMVTARKFPKMVHLRTKVVCNNAIELSFLDQEPIIVFIPQNNDKFQSIEMWDKVLLKTVDCGDDVASWLSRVLLQEDTGMRLGYWPNIERRHVKQLKYSKVYPKLRDDDTGAYSDLGSFMLMNQASVEEINNKIEDENMRASMLNYRPSLVVEGVGPFREDNWDWIRIGEEAIFRNYKPCTRCQLITVNPETGEKNIQQEPLKTLRKYRQLEDPVLKEVENYAPPMGIYLGLYKPGLIKVGDPIYIASSS